MKINDFIINKKFINERFNFTKTIFLPAEYGAAPISVSDKLYAYSEFNSTCRSVHLRSSALFVYAAYCWNTAMFDLARNVARG